MRLIDADRLKEVFRRNTGHDYSELIDIQPTVDVLNKIRAEIEEQKECRCFDDDDMFVYITGLNDAIYIIDKYKAESEDKE